MKKLAIHQVGLICLIGFIQSANALDTELHGFADLRAGARTQNDPYEADRSLTELRLQLDALTYFEASELQIRADFLYDDLADDRDDIDLETGAGFVDLREFNLLFSPTASTDVKIGRQILTWGTGDLLFINDLFPKDWNSFLLGRDEEYLKAPSDALFASWFPSVGSFDFAYLPRMDADRYVDGTRLSYWNPMMSSLAGDNSIIDAEQRDEWFKDHEIAARFYRPLLSYEASLYVYHGFWKSPTGVNAAGNAYFPRLNTYGASIRGTLGAGLINAETGFYDSREDGASVPDDEVRFLAGYEREIASNLTGSMQYYLERSSDKDRHVLTLRLTRMLMNQNLIVGLFTFYSPSDKDAYFRPSATYKISDRWMATINGNIFIGERDDTFFGQFENNSNVNLGLRYSF
jgi:hypothetical protein